MMTLPTPRADRAERWARYLHDLEAYAELRTGEIGLLVDSYGVLATIVSGAWWDYCDDISGSATVVEVGRTLNALITEGRLPRPARTCCGFTVTRSPPASSGPVPAS